MSFALYGVGTLILIVGVLYICHLVHLRSTGRSRWRLFCLAAD